MKTFEYTWDDAIFLLHLQLTRATAADDKAEAVLLREYENGQTKREPIHVTEGDSSHRCIVSRSHPKELGFRLQYPKAIVLEVFKIDDRAYYPTQSFFIG